MKKGSKSRKFIMSGMVVIVVGALICSVGYGMSRGDKSVFYEEGNHVWYKTVRFGDDFLFGIGE